MPNSCYLDINECELEEDACDEGYFCKNVVGSFECVKRGQRGERPRVSTPNHASKPCELGFRRHKDKCVGKFSGNIREGKSVSTL